jgi:hypothetical protein
MAQTDENLAEKIEKQEKKVAELNEEYKKTPSDNLQLKLYRETDILRHMTAEQVGNPKQRAQDLAEIFKLSVLSKAVIKVEKD